MRPPSDPYVSRVLSGTPVRARSRDAARRRWRLHLLITSVFDSYRPERHYMRGPGPKCRDDGSARP